MKALRDSLIVLLACAAVFWPALGRDGFSMTEGHRVIPGWEMRATGEWWLPTMFGQVYLRKPPGMSWAVGASAALLGESEFSARAVSALASTLSALLLAAFARRWFGARYAVWAGLMFALTPLFWSPGRSAEIEALHNLGALASMLVTIDLLFSPRTPAAAALFRSLALAAAFTLAGLTKGPASAPCLLAAIIAPCIVTRSSRTGRSAWFAASVIIAAAVLGLIGSKLWSAARAHDPILQTPADFLWTSSRLSISQIGAVLLMPLAALASALPSALVLPFAFARPIDPTSPADLRAAAAVWTVLLALAMYPLIGVANPRYAMPALTLIPILVPWFLQRSADVWEGRTLRASRLAMLGVPLAWPIILSAGAMAYITVIEPSQRASSGREPGRALAASLPAGATVYANDLIEARPETLLYAVRAAADAGRPVTVLWKPALASGHPPPPGTFAALRTDLNATDLTALRELQFEIITTGAVHRYAFSLFRVPAR